MLNPAASRIDPTNFVLGTQTIGVQYRFTDASCLVETAQQVRAMGSNLLKFAMSPRYKTDHYNLPERDDVRSLVDLAKNEPSVKAVLDMPFAYYHTWAYSFARCRWQDGLSDAERDAVYAEIYGLAEHLLTAYAGTGKSFYLGHWEGDWHLLQGTDRKKDPTPEAIAGMVDWLNTRQRAIDDAKRKTRAQGVYVYHYTEVNLVRKGMRGGKCMVNDVLPRTNVDFVSYSSYDTINPNRGDVRQALRESLDYIESKLPPKAGIAGKRVFIGEYGFPLSAVGSAQKQDDYARDVCIAALEWGCPFVLYWQMYCNEKVVGKFRGFWLIDDHNRKQPFYFTLQSYYKQMQQYVAEYKTQHAQPPTDAAFRAEAIRVLRRTLPPTPERDN